MVKLQRTILRSLAAKYGLNNDDDDDVKVFKEYYELFKKARKYDKDHEHEIDRLVKSRVDAMHYVTTNVPTGTAPLDFTVPYNMLTVPGMPQQLQIPDRSIDGLRAVKRANVNDKYVVFSDHHIFEDNSRQDFFSKHNKHLYLNILENYYGHSDWHLVENGDVEELIIYEPDLSELEARGKTKKWDWDDVFEYRNEKIPEQLRKIIADNQDYYSVIWNSFGSSGRYHKLVGNHDVAFMNDESLMQIIRDETGHNFDDAKEVLLLSDRNNHRYFITHGHQFDHSCTSGFAEYLGETYSQSQAWAFEGPDRNWKYEVDWIDDILSGDRETFNEMVGVKPEKMTVGDWAAVTVAFGVGGSISILAGVVSLLGMQTLFNVVPPRRLIEDIMGKNVAWEYFESPRNTTKLVDEFSSGERWFKFRHMDEFYLSEFLTRDSLWGEETPPTVVLGHTHEPRLDALNPEDSGEGQDIISTYINSGAAGRFENLIWAVEIVDGTPTMISWHYRNNDQSQAAMRTIWRPQTEDGRRILQPDDPVEMISSDNDQNQNHMPAIINMMMAS